MARTMADNDQNPQGGGAGNGNQNQGSNAGGQQGAGGTNDKGQNGDGGQQGGAGGQNSNGNQNANQNQGNPQGFDFSKLGDKDWDQIFQHDRFKGLREKASKADELTAAQTAAEEQRLKDAGEHQKLADQYKGERDTAHSTIQELRTNAAIDAAAVKAGITDLEAARLLANKADIKIDKDGTVTGAEEAVTALAEARPYLLQNNNQPRLGGGGNPPNGGQGAPLTFTGSQIRDPVFYREHAKEIDKALQSGTIDMSR